MFKYLIFVIPVLFVTALLFLRGKPNLVNAIALLLGTIVILVLDFFLTNNLILQYESRSYPSTAGVIIQSAITSRQVINHANGFNTVNTTYGVDFKYRYEVNGRSFEATRYRYNSFTASHDWAQGLVAAHPVGSQVQVFYNPQNPADALLSPGIDSTDITLILLLTFINLLVAFLWWRWIRKRISSQVAPT